MDMSSKGRPGIVRKKSKSFSHDVVYNGCRGRGKYIFNTLWKSEIQTTCHHTDPG